jgi:outer membrane protein TolC
MTAVRRLTIILCLAAAAASAQTSTPRRRPKKTTTTSTTPATAMTPATATIPASEKASADQAQTASRARTEPVTVATDKDLTDPRALHLSLDEAVRTTIQKNLGIDLTRFDFRENGQLLREAYGPFDPLATATVSRERAQSPVTSQLNSTQSSRTIVDYGLQDFVPWGGTYSLQLNNSQSRSNNAFSTLNPDLESSVGIGINQPLLRNFGIDVNTRGITFARNTLGISREAFRSVLINTADTADKAYFNLIFARQSVEVAKEALFLARDQSRITQIRIDVGASAPLDILQPRVAVATSEENLITAEALVRSSEDRLRQLMNLDIADWDRPILPTDAITFKPITVDMDSSMARGVQLRPELREADLNIANQKLAYLFAKNQVLPRLDLNLNYGFGGAAGNLFAADPNDPTQRVLVGSTGFRDSLQQIFNTNFPSWTVGVTVGIPITNIGARAEAKRAQLNVERTITDKANTQQGIVFDVRQTVRNLDTAGKQVGATRTAREAAEQNLDAERKRFENGMSTNFTVLQIQADLSNARQNELQALVGYEAAISDYHRAVGDLLEVRGITLQDPETFTVPEIPFENARWLNYGQWLKNDRTLEMTTPVNPTVNPAPVTPPPVTPPNP